MCSLRKCILKSLTDAKKIILPHNKETLLGRGPETEIIDSKLSKRQVSLLADVVACTIKVKCLGSNPSAANNKKLNKNESVVICNKERLELLAGKHVYEVEFIPPPTESRIENHKEDNMNDRVEEAPAKKIKLGPEKNEDESSSITSEKGVWENIDQGKLLIYTTEGSRNSKKIASYDLDGTLIKTKSGLVFPVDRDDWVLFNPVVKTTLRKLFNDGYKIVIFTNQAGISRGKTNVHDFKYKLEAIVKTLDVPIQVFIATSDDIYRKPSIGMWNTLIQKKNSGLSCDMDESFYVGDAAGRIKNWIPKKKKDFSSADRLFALNVGLKYFTPEKHFLKQPEGKYEMPLFDPSKLFSNSSICDTDIISNSIEVVVLVGSQGSGKSHFASTHLVKAGYFYINRDTLGTWQRCVSNMENALREGKSIVIDNTNPDKVSRKRYIDIAAKMNVPCRCFVMNTSIDHSRHNNKFRQLIGDEHMQVTDIMINSYKKKFEPPKKEEGFTEIVNINFVPVFDNPEREKLYRMFLLEK